MAEINPLYPITELTQTQYDNLEVKDENTLYAIPYSGIPPKRKNSGEGKMECVLMTQEEYDGLQVKSDNLLYCIGNPAPSYDETKILVIELGENDKPTSNIEAFTTIPDTKACLQGKTSGRYWVRIGTEAMVTTIGENGLSYSDYIVKVTIPASVLSIGYNAFASCTNLYDVDIAGVSEIGDYAFDNCTSLERIEIPETITSIGRFTFWRCANLTIIRIHAYTGTISQEPWGATSSIVSVIWDGYDPSKISVVILDSNYNDTNSVVYCVSVSDAVAAVNNSAGALLGVYVGLSSGITVIDSGAFAGSAKIGRFIQGSVTDIGSGAFYNNTALKYIELSDGLISIGDGAFNSTIIEELNVPDTLETWGHAVIQNCARITEFKIPLCVTELESSGFLNCSRLSSVTITENVTTIKQNAFHSTPSLKELFVPSTVTTIEGTANSGAFYSSSLETITIDKPQNSIPGAPWGATNATITWTG